MTARDVIAMEVSAECNTVDWERGRTDSEDVADAILAALDAAGYAVVPKKFSTKAVLAIQDAVKPHIKRHDVRCDDGRTRLEIHIDFPGLYEVMLTAAKETT